MASLPYNLVKAEQFVDGCLTTMLNYTHSSIQHRTQILHITS